MATETEAMECDSTSPELDPKKAEEIKAEGNKAFSDKNYGRAIELYTQAIGHNPSCASYYGNRSAAYMMLEDYKNALSDAQHSISLDEGFVKGYLRAAKCQTMLGSPELAIVWYDKVLALQPKNTQAIEEKKQVDFLQRHLRNADEAFDRQDYRTSLFHMDRCLDISPTCVKFKTLKAEALAMCRRLDECFSLCHDLLRMDINNCGAIYAKGLCHYYQDDTVKAHQLFQKVLRVDPDHSKARAAFKRSKQLNLKKDEGNDAFKNNDYKLALDLYTEALEIDPINIVTNAKLYCNRALMRQKLGMIEEAIEDCNQAIELDENYLRAYQRRAGLYQQNEQFEESVRDWKRVCEQDRSHDNRQSLKEAEKLLKMSKRKNYYKILGVEKTATDTEIKKAYRKKAMLHHPDRHAAADAEVREKEEVKFKEVSEAYSVLSDPKKKMRYDNGQDLDDMMGGGGHFDPSEIFSTFFSSEMGGGRSGFTFGRGFSDDDGGFGGGAGGFGGGFGGGSPFFQFRMS